MPRIRSIKPEFPKDEVVGAMSREVRLLFLQLLTLVDDAGRFRASPALIRSELYPYDDDLSQHVVGEWLAELDRLGRVRLYVHDKQQYGEVVHFLEHQRIEKPTKSTLPAPTPENTVSVDERKPPVAKLVPSTTLHVADHSPTPPGILPESSPTPPGGIGREGIGEEGRTSSQVVAVATPVNPPPVLISTSPEWPPDLADVRKALEALQAPDDLHDPPFWRGIDEWLGKHKSVAYLDELSKYLTWWRAQTGRKRHRKLKAGFRNWLTTAENRAEREAQRRFQQQQPFRR